jgi:LCP family protein required for cell wall assembly
MSRRLTTFFELLLLMVVLVSLGLGVNWTSNSAYATQPMMQAAQPTQPTAAAQVADTSGAEVTDTPAPPEVTTEPGVATEPESATLTSTVMSQAYPSITGTIGPIPTSAVIDSSSFDIEAGDAPLLVQAPRTVNVLLLGSDNSADPRYARTDTILVASINPDLPSVSLLSFARDLQVRIPGHSDDRINTAFQLGYLNDYPGGGPAFLALVLRKNFGIKIDYFVRVDFSGFVNIVDELGGVDVIVECELHDTFPDASSVLKHTKMVGTEDLDVYPGVMHLTGYQALMYSRSRESTTDFDRARRQQKVLRGLFSKIKKSNLLANALPLYQQYQENVETDLGLASIPQFIDVATRLDNLAIKTRVITYPVIKAFTRSDGAMVLLPTEDTIPYITEALSPPPGNRAQNRINVEVVNASGRKDMETVATDRLAWEGFSVVSVVVSDTVEAQTQIIDYTTTPKGSPIPRLASIFNVRNSLISEQPGGAGSDAVAQIILGKDYNSCPSTANMAGEVTLAPAAEDLIPTSTPGGTAPQ